MVETAIVIAASLVIGLGIAAFVIFVARPREPVVDPMGDQRIVELGAKVQQMGELLARAQSQLQSVVHQRLDSVTQNLQTSLDANKKDTFENLDKLNQRLAVIDNAQKNITDLASQVTSLQQVLGNKQTRGAFGQGRMEAIIQDGLPKGAYEFQPTLSNKTRPDCAIRLVDSLPLIIDAKFPLEAVTALRAALTEADRTQAIQRVRQDFSKHVSDIAEKYLIPGETQDLAFMFIPSESVYADLQEGFEDVVQKASRARVMIVSPTLLMLAIQVVQQIRRDADMREAADLIRSEVGHIMKDVKLLGERVRKLQLHFGQANEDLNLITTSAGKIEKRAARIEELEFDGEDRAAAGVAEAPLLKLGAGD